MSVRFFQIKSFSSVPVIDGFRYVFTKATRNHASGGFNGLLEINDGPEAEALADAAKDFGVWEIDEKAAIVVASKKKATPINVVDMNPQGSRVSASPVEGKEPEAPVAAVDSIDELMSDPEPEVIVESTKEEPAPKKAPVKRSRKSKKTAAK